MGAGHTFGCDSIIRKMSFLGQKCIFSLKTKRSEKVLKITFFYMFKLQSRFSDPKNLIDRHSKIQGVFLGYLDQHINYTLHNLI